MVLRLHPQVFEDRIRPKSLHVIPVLYLTMSYGIVNAITGSIGRCESLVADEEIQVFGATFDGEIGAGSSTTCQI